MKKLNFYLGFIKYCVISSKKISIGNNHKKFIKKGIKPEFFIIEKRWSETSDNKKNSIDIWIKPHCKFLITNRKIEKKEIKNLKTIYVHLPNKRRYNILLLDPSILSLLLIKKNSLIIHASAVIIKNKAFLFIGQSGAGKSTLCKFFIRKGFKTLSDDYNILRIERNKIYAYGTFYESSAKSSNCGKYQVKAIIKINKSKKNKIKFIKKEEALENLINNCINPLKSVFFAKNLLKTAIKICKRVNNYELMFKKNLEIVDYLNSHFKN